MCIFLVYLRPNEYIYVQMSIFERYGSVCLGVIRVLQAVGYQRRAVRLRK